MFTAEQIDYLKKYIDKLKPSLGGRFFYYCAPFRKKVVLQNLQQVFGNVLTNLEIHKLALAFYTHVYRSIKENILLRFMTEKQIQSKAIIKGDEHLWALEGNKIKGAILITGHFGNWEFAPIAGILSCREYQNRFFFVRKTLVNKTIEKILFRRWYQVGLGVIPKKNSLNTVCDVLEKNNAVIFVMDQHASLKAKDGILVDFLGKPAGTFKSPAMIAKYTGVPVMPIRGYRRPDGKHVLEFLPPIPWQTADNEKDELAINLRAYNAALENLVLEYPDQWLWMHKRWKTT